MHYLPFIWLGAMFTLIVAEILQPPFVVFGAVVGIIIAFMIYCDDGVITFNQIISKTRGDK